VSTGEKQAAVQHDTWGSTGSQRTAGHQLALITFALVILKTSCHWRSANMKLFALLIYYSCMWSASATYVCFYSRHKTIYVKLRETQSEFTVCVVVQSKVVQFPFTKSKFIFWEKCAENEGGTRLNDIRRMLFNFLNVNTSLSKVCPSVSSKHVVSLYETKTN
jgi:hypothetical protein